MAVQGMGVKGMNEAVLLHSGCLPAELWATRLNLSPDGPEMRGATFTQLGWGGVMVRLVPCQHQNH